jgi:hypothetical protein
MNAGFRKQLQEYEADKARVEAEKKQLELVVRTAAADEAYKAANCKNCPGCGCIVEKLSGCDSMTCGQDYHGGNVQGKGGCGRSFLFSQAPAYRAQHVQARQIEFNRERPQQIEHRWQVCEGQDMACDACSGAIIGPKFTCIHCPSLTICLECEMKGTQAVQTALNKRNLGSHTATHVFRVMLQN